MAVMFKYYNKQTRLQLRCLGVTAGMQDAVCTARLQRLDFMRNLMNCSTVCQKKKKKGERERHSPASINTAHSSELPCNKAWSESINCRKHIQHVYPAPSLIYTKKHQNRGFIFITDFFKVIRWFYILLLYYIVSFPPWFLTFSIFFLCRKCK